MSRPRAAVLEVLAAQREPTGIAVLVAATGLHHNTVREHLDALERHRLVSRRKAPPAGRGRPAWLYSAVTARTTPQSEYAGLAATLAAAITRSSEHPEADAVAAGTEWGHELARDHGRPDGADPRAGRREVLAVLDDLGFDRQSDGGENDGARSGVRLTSCPLLEAADRYPDVVCGVHLGIVRGALEEYDVDPAGTELIPFAEPGACRLHLRTGTD